MAPSSFRLNLGSGNLRIPGFVGVDFRPGPGVDVVVDLTRHPWPFADDSVEEIRAWHVLEHLPGYELDRAMHEIHRILRPGGTLYAKVPYRERGPYNPFHFHLFDRHTFDFWTKTDTTPAAGSLQDERLFERVSQRVVSTNGFPLWHLDRYAPWTRGLFYEVDERGAYSRLPTRRRRELREVLRKPGLDPGQQPG